MMIKINEVSKSLEIDALSYQEFMNTIEDALIENGLGPDDVVSILPSYDNLYWNIYESNLI